MAEATLSDEAIREIAMRCGRGWHRAEKPATAMSFEWQMSRLSNYRRAIAIAPRYVRDRDGINEDTRNAIWAHVCTETDILWKATN